MYLILSDLSELMYTYYMASPRYKRILFIRFFAYFIFFTGMISLIAEFGPVMRSELKYRTDQWLGVKYSVEPALVTSDGSAIVEPDPSASPTDGGGFGFGALTASESVIKPVSTEYGIVIEKINANALVVPGVDPGDEKQYSEALSKGVAAAKGSTNPGEPGNLYIFSHSTDAPWNIIRFNAVFYLLRELEKGDKIIVFYNNRRYDYFVFDKTVVNPTDISFLVNRYDKPVLTLQTCDPPGTVLNRLIVRAQLQGS